jgi:hypothetical protein
MNGWLGGFLLGTWLYLLGGVSGKIGHYLPIKLAEFRWGTGYFRLLELRIKCPITMDCCIIG